MHKGFTQIQASWIWVSSANVPFGVKAKARSLQQGKLAETNSYRNNWMPWIAMVSIGFHWYHRISSAIICCLPISASQSSSSCVPPVLNSEALALWVQGSWASVIMYTAGHFREPLCQLDSVGACTSITPAVHTWESIFVYIRTSIYTHNYVCMYACMYVCLSVCMYVWMYGCMYVCMYIFRTTHTVLPPVIYPNLILAPLHDDLVSRESNLWSCCPSLCQRWKFRMEFLHGFRHIP